jgi:hypothetical protein
MRIVALFGVLYVVAGAGLAQAPPPAVSPTLQSPGTMKELMLDVIYPVSDQIFYAGNEPKKSGKDWTDLRRNALMLAESANVLMASNRARDNDQWMKDARLLWEAGNKAYAAAKAQDLPAIEALNAELYEACQSCHVHYRPGYRRRP